MAKKVKKSSVKLHKVSAKYESASKNYMKFKLEGDGVILNTKLYVSKDAEIVPTHLVITLKDRSVALAEIKGDKKSV